MKLNVTPSALMTTGIVTQIHGQHLPLRFSGMLFAGGLAWGVAERYWETRAERDRQEALRRADEGLFGNEKLRD
jgi:hypothetical protein